MARYGRFAWYELLTKDVPVSITFYREVPSAGRHRSGRAPWITRCGRSTRSPSAA